MAELQPGDNNNSHQPNGGGVTPSLPSTSAEALAIAAAGSKRLRRPSVRLGEIGGDYHHAPPSYDSQSRKPKWTPTGNKTKSSTRTRALTNIGTLDDENVDSFGVVGSWRVKKRVGSSTSTGGAAKRVSSNWEESEGGFRDFSREDSESPVKEESLVRDGGGGGGFYGREGVKIWLQELGLGRYWPMFEIHEVDDEVLPLLTLDDLKDMGITAVGSRRKIFSAIQKLGTEFS
ncbi:Sterile alpha motif (SAM) domain-containing protein [Raphanus sativus]|uniref:Uncharacterized protein LOC108809431 n=1 Tax=Raphanus sativus TaxID=3726 RepID=A0A6J0JN25_RAPSA|nr:uncharacterized protein LOC108809431 [Raphanus sativus]KAJ4890337.1 Sterile alpha motif (SAM) domain-containing protein [Raphanus sativus]